MQPTTWRKSGPRRPRHSGLAGRAAMTIRRKAGTGRVGPCPSWVISRHNGLDRRCPLYPGDLNRSTQHLSLKGTDGVSGDKVTRSSRFQLRQRTRTYGIAGSARVRRRDRCGLSESRIVDLFFGGKPMVGFVVSSGVAARRALTLAEREVISRGVTPHKSARSIAKVLGRSPSTVSRELSRNGGYDRSDQRLRMRTLERGCVVQPVAPWRTVHG